MISPLWDEGNVRFKNNLRSWRDSPCFSKMRQNLHDSLGCPRDFCGRQPINQATFVSYLFSLPVIKKVAIFFPVQGFLPQWYHSKKAVHVFLWPLPGFLTLYAFLSSPVFLHILIASSLSWSPWTIRAHKASQGGKALGLELKKK